MVNASFESPYGLIKSDWKKDRNRFLLKLSIPVNTEATVYLPSTPASIIKEAGVDIKNKKVLQLLEDKEGTTILRVGSGTYDFTVE